MDYYAYQGAAYDGELQNNEPHGRGVLRMPDGSVYEGEFEHGQFHGKGLLRFPQGRIEGVWDRGELREYDVVFADELKFRPEGWEYIRPADRRFYCESTGAVPLAASRLAPGQFGSLEEVAGLGAARMGAAGAAGPAGAPEGVGRGEGREPAGPPVPGEPGEPEGAEDADQAA